MKNTYYGEIVRGNVGPVFKIYNGTFQKLGNFEADAYPMGTRVTITFEEPEPPKERVVLPEGMAWKGNLLFSPDGALIAGVRDDDDSGWYRVPFTVCKLIEVPTASMDEKERHKVIENALAEHGYFGVRKVVDNE